jgi:rod shape-determining protein MreC
VRKNNGYKIEYAIFGIVVSAITILFSMLGAFNPIINTFGYIFGDIQKSLLSFSLEWDKSFNAFNNISEIVEKSDNLEKENIKLKSDVMELQRQIQIANLSNTQRNQLGQYETIYSRVKLYSENGNEILLDKGTNDGVKKDSVAVLGNYLIGSVVEVGDNFSKVQLVNTADKIVPVKILIDNVNALIRYDSQYGYIIKDLPINYVFTEGRDVVTLGINSTFPYGLSLGKTDKLLSNKSDISQTVKINYPIDLHTLEEVFIIVQ